MAEVSRYVNVSSPIYIKDINNKGNGSPETASPPDNGSSNTHKDVEVILSFEHSRAEQGTYQDLERVRQSSVIGELTAIEQRALNDLRFEQKNGTTEPPSSVDVSERAHRSIDVLV
ncbi:MAG: hypothetical protein CMP95_08120 [Gammaproteobacteria bacterium]|nr:hypothetical protein [Gammaproteobacteria bacterium]